MNHASFRFGHLAPAALSAMTGLLCVTTPTTASALPPPYAEDFESAATCSGTCTAACLLPNGWVNDTTDQSQWIVDAGGTSSLSTGPAVDHNPGTAVGNYLYTESSGCSNQVAQIISPPLELAGTTAPVVHFWYHMLGGTMGTMHVDVDDGTGWMNDVIPSFTDDQDLWQQTPFIDLSPWIGSTVNVRIRGVLGTSFESDMAIDDFVFENIVDNDVGVTAVAGPIDNTCGLSNTDVIVEVTNFGGLPQSDVPVQVDIGGDVTATLNGTAVGPLAPLGGSELVNVGTIDTFVGANITVDAMTTLAADQFLTNDALATQALAINGTGVAVTPPAPVCPGDSVSLTVPSEAGTIFGWYDALTGGTLLGTGDTFVSPPVLGPTTFWVQRDPNTERVGPANNTDVGPGGTFDGQNEGLLFNVAQPVVIEDVAVYPNAAGDVVVNLRDSGNNLLDTATVAVSQSLVKTTIPLNFQVDPGLNYRLDIAGSTVPFGLFRNTAGSVFPYTGTDLQITNSINAIPGTYYYFYDWTVTRAFVCGGERSSVDVTTIDPTTCMSDLAVSITDSLDPVPPGSSLQYEVTITNTGMQAANGVVVTSMLGAEVTNPVTTGCAEDPGGLPSCNLDFIPAGGTVSFTVDVDVDAAAVGPLNLQASAATIAIDVDATNDAASEDTQVGDMGGTGTGDGGGSGTGMGETGGAATTTSGGPGGTTTSDPTAGATSGGSDAGEGGDTAGSNDDGGCSISDDRPIAGPLALLLGVVVARTRRSRR